MSRHDDRAYLFDILDSIRAIQLFTADWTLETIRSDRVSRNALIRELEVIGEAAGHVSPEMRDLLPEIPWQKVVAMRNALIHGYRRVLPDVVWQTAQTDLAPMADVLRRYLDEHP